MNIMCPSYKRKVPPESCLKGQIFFVWSNPQNLQIALEKIPLLGGRIDSFLSKDITTILIEDVYLVSAQYCDDIAVRASYTSNGIVTTGFNHPGVLYNLPSTSRGYNLIQNSTANSPYRVIVFARQWGIQLLGIGYFLSSIEPIVKSISHLNSHTKKSQNISNLTGCFIKFECFHKKFRPCYKMFSNDPERLMPLRNANILVKAETCNVILEKPVGPRQLHFNHMDPNNRIVYHAQDAKPPVKAEKKFQKLKPKEENNYCECCRTHFNDLRTHIKSANHQKFVSNEKNYEPVNDILKMLPSAQEFIQKHQKLDQTPDLTLHNGEVMSNNTSSALDFSMPLNLHIKKAESPVPLNLLDKPCEEITLPLNLHLKKDLDVPMPLNLHLKQNEEIKEVPQIVNVPPDPVFVNEDGTNSICKSEIDVVGIKPDSPPAGDIADCKDFCIPEMTNELLYEPPIGDPLFDKTNTATLAQLCIKNFESCWMENMDNIPEMDDMIFDDDIFDFEDSKQKSNENDYPDQEDNFSPSHVLNSPGLVSGISTDLKTQSNINTSILNNSVDLKDVSVKIEPVNTLESYSPVCKTESEFKDTLSPSFLNINQSLVNEKKLNFSGNFDIKPNTSHFYADKQDVDMSPSCSNAMAVKLSEQMFSSDSSDDENGNVFISNVLNIITTNSDSEMKIDRDNIEEDSASNSKSAVPLNNRKASISNSEESCSSTFEVRNNDQSCIDNAAMKVGVPSVSNPELSCSSQSPVNIDKNSIEMTCSNNALICASYSDINLNSGEISSSAMTGLSNSMSYAMKSEVTCENKLEHPCVSTTTMIINKNNNTETTCTSNAPISCASYSKIMDPVEITNTSVPVKPGVNTPMPYAKKVEVSCGSKTELSCVSKPAMSIDKNNIERTYTGNVPLSYAGYSKVISPTEVTSASKLTFGVDSIMSYSRKAEVSCSSVSKLPCISQPILNSGRNNTEMVRTSDALMQHPTFSKMTDANAAQKASVSNLLTGDIVNITSPSVETEVSYACKPNLLCVSKPAVDININNAEITCSNSTYVPFSNYSEVRKPNPVEISCVKSTGIAGVSNTEMIDARNSIISDVSSVSMPGVRNSSLSSISNNSVSSVGNKSSPDKNLKGTSIKTVRERTLVNTYEYVCVNNMEVTKRVHSRISDREVSHRTDEQVCSSGTELGCKSRVQQTRPKKFEQTFVGHSAQLRVNDLEPVCKNNALPVSVNREPVCKYSKEKMSRSAERIIDVHTEDRLSTGVHSAHSKAPSSEYVPKIKKIPHKKSIRKLRKLPSLWSVCILPGKGLKLKFTCLQPESFVTVESDEEGTGPSEQSECQ